MAQAPHSPSSHPCFVPQRFRSSRRISSSVLYGANARVAGSPLTLRETEAGGGAAREKAADGKIGHEIGNVLWGIGSLRTEPVGCPIECAEERAGRDRGLADTQRALANAVGNQRANSAFVAVTLGQDARDQVRRQRMHLEVSRSRLDLVDQTQHVRHGQGSKAVS